MEQEPLSSSLRDCSSSSPFCWWFLVSSLSSAVEKNCSGRKRDKKRNNIDVSSKSFLTQNAVRLQQVWRRFTCHSFFYETIAALVAPIIGELTPFAHCHASAVIHSGLPLFPQSEFRSQNGEWYTDPDNLFPAVSVYRQSLCEWLLPTDCQNFTPYNTVPAHSKAHSICRLYPQIPCSIR